jgi:hypothetical protein
MGIVKTEGKKKFKQNEQDMHIHNAQSPPAYLLFQFPWIPKVSAIVISHPNSHDPSYVPSQEETLFGRSVLQAIDLRLE